MGGVLSFFVGMYHSDTGNTRQSESVMHVRGDPPIGMSNDATTSTEKDTVEAVADNSVVTRFDESLISALKRA